MFRPCLPGIASSFPYPGLLSSSYLRRPFPVVCLEPTSMPQRIDNSYAHFHICSTARTLEPLSCLCCKALTRGIKFSCWAGPTPSQATPIKHHAAGRRHSCEAHSHRPCHHRRHYVFFCISAPSCIGNANGLNASPIHVTQTERAGHPPTGSRNFYKNLDLQFHVDHALLGSTWPSFATSAADNHRAGTLTHKHAINDAAHPLEVASGARPPASAQTMVPRPPERRNAREGACGDTLGTPQ